MEQKKLIFLDIDGTLTIPGENVPPESAQEAIRAARAAGHRVFISTGRNPGMSRALFPYGFDGAVCCAGGYILCGGRVIYDQPLTAEEQDDLLSALEESGAFYILEALEYSYEGGGTMPLSSNPAAENSEIGRWRKLLREKLSVLPVSAYRGEAIYKAVFACLDLREIESARKRLEDRFACCVHELFPGVVNGEFVNRKFNKGRAIERVCRELGVSVKDTVAFGDSMNDLEMVERAGTGVAMGSGSATLKERADYVCPGVAEDGLARAFRELGLI